MLCLNDIAEISSVIAFIKDFYESIANVTLVLTKPS